MSELVRQRCFSHGTREAVARCPACRRYFCRECVTEHEGRVICASCLRATASLRRGLGGPLRGVVRAVGWSAQCVVGWVVVWTFFYFLGRLLQLLPTPVHDGSVWIRLLR